MLTKKARSAGNNCKPLYPSQINIYDARAPCEQSIFNSDTSVTAGKCTVHSRSSSVRLWAMWVQGQWVGVLAATYICISYHHIHVVTHVFDTWAREGGTLDPTFCFSGLTWHLASSWLNWQLLWTTKWPRMIPLLVSKPSPDSWLVNYTSKPVAKQDMRCQSGSSHVETPGKVIQLEEARRSKEEEEEEERGGWGVQQACYMLTTLHYKWLPLGEIVKSNPAKTSTPTSSQIEVNCNLVRPMTSTKGLLFSKFNHSSSLTSLPWQSSPYLNPVFELPCAAVTGKSTETLRLSVNLANHSLWYF